jgi:RNase P subunit RPR2
MAELLVPTGSTQSTTFQDACKVNHLWRSALAIFSVDRNLSRSYIQDMVQAARNSSLDIHFIQSCFCGNCQLIYVPGVTCKISQHQRGFSSKAYKRARRIAQQKHLEVGQVAPATEMVYTCTECGSTTSICTSTRKQQGEKRARTLAKLVGKKRKSSSNKPTAATVVRAGPTVLLSTSSSIPTRIPTSILTSSPRRKKKKKKEKESSLGHFVNNL